MLEHRTNRRPTGLLRDLASLGTRAATIPLRPFSGALGAAAGAGLGLERRALGVERRAVDRLLESDELQQMLTSLGNSARLRALLGRALESDVARELVEQFFDSGLFDHLAARLLASDALWYLVDEIAQSPAVTAAISGQGLGFADQVGGAMRTRSRNADDWLEQATRRMTHRRAKAPAAAPDGDGS